MKKTSLFRTFTLVLSTAFILINSCKVDYNKNDYMRKVLGNLEEIRSATYFSTLAANPPGDTVTLKTFNYYKKEFVNPADTFIGSAYVWFNGDDTSKLYLCYDGNASIDIYNDSRTIIIDSFKTSFLPFRPVSEPFFKQAVSLIKYALKTNDSISTDLTDYGDSIRFSLLIPDKIITFHGGRPYVSDSPYLSEDEKYSNYEMWINKSNDLPYRIGHKLSYGSSMETCSKVEFNKSRLEDFIPAKYFPSDFTIRERGVNQAVAKELTGTKASDWVLNDSENNSVALKDFKSNVLMIEFTGIGCGPCHSAVPFLKQLVAGYKNTDFELIGIETWSQEIDALKRYKDNNKLNYTFLVSTDDVMKNYNAQAVPVFYILDKDRVIRKIIRGYAKGTTDKEIREAINELI
ncbi:MAG: TlpA disulfide reductase family protein [Bacteroidales bacterium]